MLNMTERLLRICAAYTFYAYWENFLGFLSSADLFQNTIRMSNRLDPDQAQRLVGPDLYPNCLQKLSADDTRRLSHVDY